jgi:hypothetical protein
MLKSNLRPTKPTGELTHVNPRATWKPAVEMQLSCLALSRAMQNLMYVNPRAARAIAVAMQLSSRERVKSASNAKAKASRNTCARPPRIREVAPCAQQFFHLTKCEGELTYVNPSAAFEDYGTKMKVLTFAETAKLTGVTEASATTSTTEQR